MPGDPEHLRQPARHRAADHGDRHATIGRHVSCASRRSDRAGADRLAKRPLGAARRQPSSTVCSATATAGPSRGAAAYRVSAVAVVLVRLCCSPRRAARGAGGVGSHVARLHVESRFDLYDRALEQFGEHPVMGLGIGGFHELNDWGTGRREHYAVHNTYLWALVDMGIAGRAAAHGAVVGAIARAAAPRRGRRARPLRSSRDRWPRWRSSTCSSTATTSAISGCSSHARSACRSCARGRRVRARHRPSAASLGARRDDASGASSSSASPWSTACSRISSACSPASTGRAGSRRSLTRHAGWRGRAPPRQRRSPPRRPRAPPAVPARPGPGRRRRGARPRGRDPRASAPTCVHLHSTKAGFSAVPSRACSASPWPTRRTARAGTTPARVVGRAQRTLERAEPQRDGPAARGLSGRGAGVRRGGRHAAASACASSRTACRCPSPGAGARCAGATRAPGIPEAERWLVFVGRLTHEKGSTSCSARSRRRSAPTALLVVGDGAERARLEAARGARRRSRSASAAIRKSSRRSSPRPTVRPAVALRGAPLRAARGHGARPARPRLRRRRSGRGASGRCGIAGAARTTRRARTTASVRSSPPRARAAPRREGRARVMRTFGVPADARRACTPPTPTSRIGPAEPASVGA